MIQTELEENKDLQMISKSDNMDLSVPIEQEQPDVSLKFLEELKITPINISWKNLTISATMKDSTYKKKHICDKSRTKEKIILDNLQGNFKEGSLTSILGPSGSGKTTFLNFLSNKLNASNLSAKGTVLINNNEVANLGKFTKAFGYVEQDDVLFSHQTPFQILEFAARLRFPIKDKDKQLEAINQVIKQFDLESCRDRVVGNKINSKISKSERKRLCIGIELLANPNLLFLDEPTTGLDSVTAFQILLILKSIASQGRTVITTLHQPSSNLFSQFDQLLLLVEGNIIYQGSAASSITHFEKNGYACDELMNPADYYMNIMNPEGMMIDELKKQLNAGIKSDINRDKIITDYKDRIVFLREKFEESDQFKERLAHEQNIQKTDISALEDKAQKQNSYWYEIKSLLTRNLKGMGKYLFISVFFQLFIAALCIILYSDLGKGINYQMNINGLIMIIAMSLSMLGVMDVSQQIFDERHLYIKETQNKTYRAGSYLISKQLGLFVHEVLSLLLFQFVLWFGLGLSKDHYFVCYLIIYLVYETSASMGYWLSSFMKNLETLVNLVPMTVIPFICVSGSMINVNDIKWYLKWLEYISLARYGYSGLFQRMMKDVDQEDLYDPKNCSNQPGNICDPVGDADFPESIALDIIFLLVLIVLFRTLALILLKKRSMPFKLRILKSK